MRLLALDIAKNCGFALGEAEHIPPSEVRIAILKGATQPERNVAFGAFLRDTFIRNRPDMIVAEDMMEISAQPNRDTAISQVGFHAILDSLAGLYGIPVRRIRVSSIRKAFCGRPTAEPPVRGRRRSEKEAKVARLKTKRMVAAMAVQWGYVPPGCADFDKTDACAVFHVGGEMFCGVKRSHVIAFGKLVPVVGVAA